MKTGGRKNKNRAYSMGGYTIVEVMIFLVITGILLATATLVFNGQQQRTQFTQGVRETEARIRTIINEVASGYYPNKNDFNCSAADSGTVTINAASSGQGSNEGCIFLGKTLNFSKTSSFNVYTIVGRQKVGDKNSQEATNFNETKPSIIVSEVTGGPDNTEAFKMPGGVHPYKIVAPGYCGDTSAVSFVHSFGNYSGEDLVSGNQALDLVPLTCPSLEDSFDKDQIATQVSDMKDAERDSSEYIICLKSGGNDRKAAIVLGSKSNELSTSSLIDKVPEECDE